MGADQETSADRAGPGGNSLREELEAQVASCKEILAHWEGQRDELYARLRRAKARYPHGNAPGRAGFLIFSYEQDLKESVRPACTNAYDALRRAQKELDDFVNRRLLGWTTWEAGKTEYVVRLWVDSAGTFYFEGRYREHTPGRRHEYFPAGLTPGAPIGGARESREFLEAELPSRHCPPDELAKLLALVR